MVVALEPRVRLPHVHLRQRAVRQREAYGSGDSGIYPGSGPEGHCRRYGIEVRYSESYGNTIGWSGTAGNGVWTHDSKFHHNSAGITMDSFAGGHPGMPQDCSKWVNNQIYSNNADLFNDKRDAYCKNTPTEQRDPRKVCPTFQVPVGTGILTGGGNGNIFKKNWIYDNWRRGTMLFWVPGELRGEDPTGQSAPNRTFETSHNNKYIGNRMGFRPSGRRDPNGVDFWWDEEGGGNCWSGNKGPRGGRVHERPDPAVRVPRAAAPTRPAAPPSRARCSSAPPGTRRPIRIRSAATGSRVRASPSSAARQVGAGRRPRGARAARAAAAAGGGHAATWSGTASRRSCARRPCRATAC